MTSAAPRWLLPVQPFAPYTAVTGVFGVYWGRGRGRVVGNGREGRNGCWDGVRERGMEENLSPALKVLL